MVRADTAKVSAYPYAGALRGLADSASLPIFNQYLTLEPWLRRAVPAMIALFIATLATVSFLVAREAHEQTIQDAISDLEALAATATENFNFAMSKVN